MGWTDSTNADASLVHLCCLGVAHLSTVMYSLTVFTAPMAHCVPACLPMQTSCASLVAADGDEGGRHQLVGATVSGGKLWIIKVQIGDKRWFKGAKREATGAFDSFAVL